MTLIRIRKRELIVVADRSVAEEPRYSHRHVEAGTAQLGQWDINNILVTQTVMNAAPVDRGVASAAYSFVRYAGAAVAPWVAGVLSERINVHCRSGAARQRCCSAPAS
jgi:hypothetical protein